MRRVAMAAAVLFLGGCASGGLSEGECRTADWRAIGFEDGARGASPASFGAHRRACADHGVTPRFDAYLAGHAKGLETFCRPHNGARLGASGFHYSGECPAHLEGPFVAAYSESYGLYERESAVQSIRKRLHAKRQRSNRIEKRIVENTAALVAPHLAPAERATLAVDLKQLGEQKVAVEVAIRQLEYDLAAAERECDSYRSAIANHSIY